MVMKCFNIWNISYITSHSFLTGSLDLRNDLLSFSWLERRIGIARSRVQTPLETWLFQASISNCLNCPHNCEDHSLLDFKSAVHGNISYITSRKKSRVGAVVRAVTFHQYGLSSILSSTPHVGYVWCLSTLLWEFFPWVLRFSAFTRNQNFESICCDSVSFVVSSISKAGMLG